MINRSMKQGCMKALNVFRGLIRIQKNQHKLIIVVIMALFIACLAWLGYAIFGFAILWEFFGQSINAKSDRYSYGFNEPVNCQITYHVSQADKYIYVEITDDMSGVVVASEIIWPLVVYGYHDVYYDEYTTNQAGYYKCHVEIRDTGVERFGWQASTFNFIVCSGGQQYTNTLKLWCGDNIKGNPNEKLRPVVDKTAHYIAVQVEGTDHGAQVLFESDQCTFEHDGQHSIEKDQKEITINGQTIYIAKTWVKLPDDLVLDGSYLPCLVKASQEEASNYIEILIYSINDGEKSHNIGTYTHQTNNSGEVLGDNYISTLDNQGSAIIDYGDASDSKDIMIELDWYNWGNINITDIEEIAELTKEILYSAGIDISNSIFIGNEINNMPTPTTSAQRKSLLAQHKAYLHDEPPWHNSIHVILGSEESDLNLLNTFGVVEDHHNIEGGSTSEDWQYFTWHLASGHVDYRQPFLDSTGCFVFAKQVVDYLSLIPHKPTDNEAIALVTAHEIGHSLGMWHYPDNYFPHYLGNHVMVKDFYLAFHSATGFDDYGKFSPKTLNGDFDLGPENQGQSEYTWDGMNTRHVIGIHTVNMFEY